MTSDTDTEVFSSPAVADFGTRFSAFMIDAAVLVSAQWLVFIVLSRQLQAVGMTSRAPCSADPLRMCEGPSDVLWAVLLVVLFVSTVGYHGWFEGRHGATPGKRWMGLAVTGLDGKSPIGLARGVTRSVVRQAFWLSLFFLLEASPVSVPVPSVVFVAIPILAIAGIALGGVMTDGRSLHDRVAGTVVIRATAPGKPADRSRSNRRVRQAQRVGAPQPEHSADPADTVAPGRSNPTKDADAS